MTRPPLRYLDWNATQPLRAEAAAAMASVWAAPGNPSSVHGFGRAARRIVEQARRQVAALVGADPAEVVFTASGTEADNLALAGYPDRVPVVSAIEHDAVLRAAAAPAIVPVTADGVVDLDRLDAMLAALGRPALVSIMLANNETGVIQPVAEAVAVARRHGALVHTDAVQAAGRIAIDIAALGVDLLTLSAHKLGGPQGAGALIVRGAAPRPLLRGGGQERGLRAGTENVAALAGFGIAAELAAAELPGMGRIACLRDRLEAAALALAPETRMVGGTVPRLPNTSCLARPGLPAETQVMALDLAGFAVSAGAACSSGKVKASHVLAAMGLPAASAGAAIRVSLGRDSTAADVDDFIHAWHRMHVRAERPAASAA